MSKPRLVLKHLPMRRATVVDPETDEFFLIRVYASEVLINGKVYGNTVTGPDEDEHPDIVKTRQELAARALWAQIAHQLLVETGGPNLDDPDWHEDQAWLGGSCDE